MPSPTSGTPPRAEPSLVSRLLGRTRTIRSFVGRHWFGLSYGFGAFVLLAISVITAHIYDDTAFAQHAYLYYDVGVNPLYYSLQGTYYTFALVASFAPVIWGQGIGPSDVLVQQFFLKVPFTLPAIFSGPVLYRILRPRLGELRSKLLALAWIFDPMVYFVAAVHGSPIAFSVFFLLVSLLLLERNRERLSAVAYGVATATFIYPVLALPALLYGVKRDRGFRASGIYLLITAAVVAVGQLPPLLLSSAYGLGTSQGLVVSSGNLSIGGPELPPQYSVFDILNVFHAGLALTATDYLVIFLVAMLLPNVFYIWFQRRTRGPIDAPGFYLFFFVEGLIFALLEPKPGPQFLLAAVPFAIIVTGLVANTQILTLFRFGILVDIGLAFIGAPQNLFGFLGNTDPSLLNYAQTFPYQLFDWLALAYGLVLVGVIGVAVWSYRRTAPTVGPPPAHELERWAGFNGIVRHHTTTNAMIIVLVTLLAFAAVSPALSSPPGVLYNLNSLDTWQVQPTSISVNPANQNVTAQYQLPGVYVLSTPSARLLSQASVTDTDLLKLSPTVYYWFAVNTSFSYNATDFAAQNVTFDASYVNTSYAIIVYGSAPASTQLSLCTHLPPSPCDGVFSLPGISATSQAAPGGFHLLTFPFIGTVSAGSYFLEVTAPGQSGPFLIGGSTGFPSGQGVDPLLRSTGTVANATLALKVTGSPVLQLTVNGNREQSKISLVNGSVPVTSRYLAPTTTLTFWSLGELSKTPPTLVISLPFDSIYNEWRHQPLSYALGSLGCVAGVLSLPLAVRRLWITEPARP